MDPFVGWISAFLVTPPHPPTRLLSRCLQLIRKAQFGRAVFAKWESDSTAKSERDPLMGFSRRERFWLCWACVSFISPSVSRGCVCEIGLSGCRIRFSCPVSSYALLRLTRPYLHSAELNPHVAVTYYPFCIVSAPIRNASR